MTDNNLPWQRISAVAGVVFAVVFFLGTASLNVPHGETDQKMLDWWSDSGNQTTAIVSGYAFIFAALLALIFVSGLRARFEGSGDDARFLTPLMFAAGIGSAALLAASGATRAVIAVAVKVNDEQLPGVDLLRFFPQLAYGFIGAAMLFAALMIAAVAALTFRTGRLPAWIGWVSVLAALLLFVLTPVLGGLLIPVVLLWTLAASVAVWMHPAPTP